MALVMNASCEEVNVRAFGNHFTLKPGQIKDFGDSIANFMCVDRSYLGFVSLPEEFSDPDFKNTEQGKKILEDKRKQGVAARVKHLRSIIYNNEVSLRRDLEQANIKTDPKLMASEGELKAYRELAKYQRQDEDQAQAVAEEIAALQKVIKAE